MATDTLSLEDARRVALSAQGLRGARTTKGGVAAMLRRLGAVQLDTISVLARSHELVAYARLGAVGRTKVEQAYWGPRSETFEYWSHAACVLPLADWPAVRVQAPAIPGQGPALAPAGGEGQVVSRGAGAPARRGPLTANQLGGAKKGGPWWDWSETKIAAEWLLDIGELVCRERRGFARVYDLAERAIPAATCWRQDWSDEECAVRLVAAAGRALGVALPADLAKYHGLPQALVRRVLDSSGLTKVSVAGWAQPAYADPGALERGGHPDARAARCCSPRSTRSSGTGSASSASSTSGTGSRRIRRRRSASTATSPCRCSTGLAWWAWSTRAGGARCWWPNR